MSNNDDDDDSFKYLCCTGVNGSLEIVIKSFILYVKSEERGSTYDFHGPERSVKLITLMVFFNYFKLKTARKTWRMRILDT